MKTLSGETTLKSFEQTVVTPRKCVGREAPQRPAVSFSTVTHVTYPWGYISSGEVVKSPSHEALASLRLSPSKSRGYFARSSLGPNCVGLTKTLAIARPHSALARRTSER